MAKKKQQKTTLTWSDFNKVEDDIFQFALRSYVCNNPGGFDKLVASFGAKKAAKELMLHVEAFTIEDKVNNIHIRAEIEQLALSSKTGRMLSRISVDTTKPDKKGKGVINTSRSFFKTQGIGGEGMKLSALEILEEVVDVLGYAARTEYNDILKEMGLEVKNYYD